MKSLLHALVGAIALLCIATFWLATAISELFMSQPNVAAVKLAILKTMWLLVPAMIATGISGLVLSGNRAGRIVEVKKIRMKIIAINGLCVLLPSAYALASLASAGTFNAVFYGVQALELAVGTINITLLVLNMRDGLRLSGRLSPNRARKQLACAEGL
jgi:hypothetical protein